MFTIKGFFLLQRQKVKCSSPSTMIFSDLMMKNDLIRTIIFFPGLKGKDHEKLIQYSDKIYILKNNIWIEELNPLNLPIFTPILYDSYIAVTNPGMLYLKDKPTYKRNYDLRYKFKFNPTDEDLADNILFFMKCFGDDYVICDDNEFLYLNPYSTNRECCNFYIELCHNSNMDIHRWSYHSLYSYIVNIYEKILASNYSIILNIDYKTVISIIRSKSHQENFIPNHLKKDFKSIDYKNLYSNIIQEIVL